MEPAYSPLTTGPKVAIFSRNKSTVAWFALAVLIIDLFAAIATAW